jgi:quinol monooxygenase YgiN
MKAVTVTGTIALAALFAISGAAQAPNDYLDYYVVKVRPEKRADFDGVMKKIAEANRKNHGDQWLAFQTEYGENNTVYFASSRKDFAAIDSANDTFMKAMKESFGPGYESMLREIDACAVGTRGELHKRRWDLSFNPPANAEDSTRQLGEARWLRVSSLHIRPGHTLEFENLLREMKETIEKNSPSHTTLVSQMVAGGAGGVTYYFSVVQPTLGGFDSATTSIRELLGDEAYKEHQDQLAEMVVGTDTMLARFLPELSNPPEEIVNVSSDFWTPKAAPMVMAAREKKKKADR